MLCKAPEQLRNPNIAPTKEGDIYSVGIIIQEVVIRGLPFEHERRDDVDDKGEKGMFNMTSFFHCVISEKIVNMHSFNTNMYICTTAMIQPFRNCNTFLVKK